MYSPAYPPFCSSGRQNLWEVKLRAGRYSGNEGLQHPSAALSPKWVRRDSVTGLCCRASRSYPGLPHKCNTNNRVTRQ